MAVKLTINLPDIGDKVRLKNLDNSPEMIATEVDANTAQVKCWWFTEGNDSRGYGQWALFPAKILKIVEPVSGALRKT